MVGISFLLPSLKIRFLSSAHVVSSIFILNTHSTVFPSIFKMLSYYLFYLCGLLRLRYALLYVSINQNMTPWIYTTNRLTVWVTTYVDTFFGLCSNSFMLVLMIG